MHKFLETQKTLITALKDKRSFAIGYHPDADGISATAILLKYLQKNGVRLDTINLFPVDNIARTFELEHLDEILAKKYDAIICIDYSVTRYEQLSYLRKKFDLIIYLDHHRYQPELKKIPHLYINSVQFPQLTQPQWFTASKLTNSLFYSSSNDWLELIGLDGDVAIQSIIGSHIYEASRRLNMLGLVKQQNKNLKEITTIRNSLVYLLLSSKDVFEFLDKINNDGNLTTLYLRILKDIEINVNTLMKLKPEINDGNNKIYIHKIVSPDNFEIAEHILKEHIRHLGHNDTVVIYSTLGHYITFRIYSSSHKVDCEKLARQFFGGGHKNRAGVTNMPLEDLPAEPFIEMVVERIREMIIHDE